MRAKRIELSKRAYTIGFLGIVLILFGLFQFRNIAFLKAQEKSVLIEELLLTKGKYNKEKVYTSGYLLRYGESENKFHYAIFSSREYYISGNPEAAIDFSLDKPLDTKCYGRHINISGQFKYHRVQDSIFSQKLREMTDVHVMAPMASTPAVLDNLLAADFYSYLENAPNVEYQYEWISPKTSKGTEDKLKNIGIPTHCYKEEGRDLVFENVTILDVATPQFGSGVLAVWAVVEAYVPNQFPEQFYIPYGGAEQKLPEVGAKCTITSHWARTQGVNDAHNFSENDLYQVPTKIKCDGRALP